MANGAAESVSEAAVRDAIEDVLALVRRHGGRATPARRLLLNALFGNRDHRSAEELAAEVPDEIFADLVRLAVTDYGFTINPHRFAVTGRCAACHPQG